MDKTYFEKLTIRHYLFKYKKQFFLSSLGGILYNTLIVTGPILLGKLLDASLNATKNNLNVLYLSALYFFLATLFFQYMRFIKRWYIRDHFNRVASDMREELIGKLLGNNLSSLEKEKVGDLMSRTINDIAFVVETIRKNLTEVWDTWLLMLSYFVTLLIYDWKITLIAVIPIPFTILLAEAMRHPLYNYSMSLRKATSKATKGLHDSLTGLTILRLFGKEKEEYRKVANAFEEQSKWSIKSTLLSQSLLPVYSLIAGIGIVIVIALGGQKTVLEPTSKAQFSVGTFNAFLTLFIALATRTKTAAKVFNNWHQAKAAWVRITEKMTSDDKKTHGLIPDVKSDMLLTVNNLSFGFDDDVIIKNVSFTLKKGEIIGVTGSVGSGKTALANALTGLYPYEGSIKLYDTELKNVDAKIRSEIISYTGHEQFLFSKTIAENIAFSDHPDSDKLTPVLQYSGLTNDINQLDKGIDTIVGEKGVRVSGGQRQRISLARVLYSNAKVIILDDPFSAVDIYTEKLIISQLKEIVKDRSIIIFSHRLLSFENVDKIIVFDSGSVVQTGTHNELINKEGIYKDIYQAQAFLGVDNNEKE